MPTIALPGDDCHLEPPPFEVEKLPGHRGHNREEKTSGTWFDSSRMIMDAKANTHLCVSPVLIADPELNLPPMHAVYMIAIM
jgi:hypothetical protein